MRYVLIRTSINTIARNHIPELIGRAVEMDVWTPRHALSVAAKIPDAAKRVGVYNTIMRTGKLNKDQQEEAQQLGLEGAMAVEDERKRAEILIALAPQLRMEQRTLAVEKALVAALALQSEQGRTEVLTMLAPQLTEGLLEGALGVEDEQKRA